MNRSPFSLAMICSLILSSGLSAVADEPKSAALLQTLPADGSWTSFSITAKVNGQELVLTGTARSVGQAIYEGQKCRCIEYEQTVESLPENAGVQLPNGIWRMLVPEAELGDGKDPLSKAVKTWVKTEAMEPEVVESIEARDPVFALLLHGPKTNLKTEKAKEKIDWQRGQLECAVISGQNVLELGVIKLKMTMRVFRHSDVPFGIAGLHEDLDASFGGNDNKVIIRVTLRDHGKDAKAKLPELVK